MEKVIETIEKNTREEIRIALTKYKGFDLVDLRVFFHTGVLDDDPKPTKKGITFKTEVLPEVIEGLEEAKNEILNSDSSQ